MLTNPVDYRASVNTIKQVRGTLESLGFETVKVTGGLYANLGDDVEVRCCLVKRNSSLRPKGFKAEVIPEDA